MKALILIGGLGTRLRPLTCTTPKPLLSVVNRPFLHYQLDLLKKHGIREVMFCISYLPGSFKKYFGNGKKYGLRISYAYEQTPLGTGGAVKNAEKWIDQPVVVINGDILTDISLTRMRTFHEKNRAQVTVALTKVKDPTAYGLILTDKKGKIKKFIEKPSRDEVVCNTINAGTYIFNPDVLAYMPAGIQYSLERQFFPTLVQKKIPLYGYLYHQYWLDMGTTDNYLKAHGDILKGTAAHLLPGIKTKQNKWLGKNITIRSTATVVGPVACGDFTFIGDSARLNGPVSIGKRCRIGKGAILENCVILNACVIGEGARLTGCIIGNHCVIEPYAVINKGIVLGDRSTIRRYGKL